MLIGNQSDDGLQQGELAYAALRLTVIDTLMHIEMVHDWRDSTEPAGFLDEVPVLENVAPIVQVDLLADAWNRHRATEQHNASLLDAAVIYAACETAARVVEEQLELARRHLATGPLPCRLTIDSGLPERFRELFESFWGDIDFVTLELLADMDPVKAERIKHVLGISKTQIKKIQAALGRSHASRGILQHLDGLLTEEELLAWSRVLVPPVVVSLRDVVSEMDTPGDTFQAFLNRKTGELFTATDDELNHLDDPLEPEEDMPDWQREMTSRLREIRGSEDWLELPSKREFDEWSIVAEFCGSIENQSLRQKMLEAIHGGGAFGRFKTLAHQQGLIDEWYRFRDQQLAAFVAGWLKANGIAFTK